MKSRIAGISLAFLLACLAKAPVNFAQHSPSSADAAPATILPGMGSLHHGIATSNPEAQRFFDQGLTLVYAFNYDEAIRYDQRAHSERDTKTHRHTHIRLTIGVTEVGDHAKS